MHTRTLTLTVVTLIAFCLSLALPILPGEQISVAAAQDDRNPVVREIEYTDCFFSSYYDDVECGYLLVPENRDDPDSPMIRIAFSIFHSRADNPEPDPIVYLSGGPGGYNLEFADSRADGMFYSFLEERDLILFDQRGVGYSEPSLNCPEVEAARAEYVIQTSQEASEAYIESAVACSKRLESEGIHVEHYNSRENAADLNDLRVALGYDEWNLLGISYGSRLAMTAMRDYPEGIRSVILDSVYPPEVNAYYFANPRNMERVMELIFTECENDATCAAAYPNLRTIFYKVVEQLNAEPVTLAAYDYTISAYQNAVLDGDRLVVLITDYLYSPRYIPEVPALIYDLRVGNYERVTSFLDGAWGGENYHSEGMHLAVQCGEDVPFITPDVLQGLEADALPLLWQSKVIVPDWLNLCQGFVDVAPEAVENDPVVSDIPTLIFTGEYDPVTPPAWGELAAQSLTNSYVYEFPGVSHGVMGEGNCPENIAHEFVLNPHEEPDTYCIESFEAPLFSLD
jgi:pimeloyl-ACP methyl ester carboxylesterase